MTKPYYPGLDGLRAVAIVIVLLGHAGVPYVAPHVGVDIFFTLSGFLITSLLVAEHDRHGSIGLRHFYMRRILRLAPALWLTVALVLVIACWLNVWGRWTLRDAGLALSYTTNWARVSGLNRVALPNGFVLDSPLGHTWSLAIEEQYYLIWPLVIALLCQRVPDARSRAVVLFSLFGFFAVYRALMVGYLSPERIYFGLDTHADGLILGGGLAASLCSASLWWSAKNRLTRMLAMGVAAGVLLAALQMDWHTRSAGLVGFSATAIASSLFILDSVSGADGGLFRLVLTHPSARWIGRVSYGLYLWHYPVYFAARQSAILWSWQRLLVVGASTSLLLAAASFYLVEQRFLKLKARFLRADLSRKSGHGPKLSSKIVPHPEPANSLTTNNFELQ
jgi:peptidoglycan/LPS O-acetylase OafA/YrhL